MTKLEKYFSWQVSLFAGLWFICLMVSCNEQATVTVDEDPGIDHAEVDRVYEQMAIAYRKADINIIGEIYADSAIYFNPGEPIQFGEKEFIGGFNQLFQQARDDGAQLSLEFEIKKRTAAGAKVFDVGYYRFSREREGEEPIASVGKFMTVLQKRGDGAYEFVADVNSLAPVEAWKN